MANDLPASKISRQQATSPDKASSWENAGITGKPMGMLVGSMQEKYDFIPLYSSLSHGDRNINLECGF